MRTNLLQSFQIFTQLRVHAVRQNLRILSIGDIALSVEKPRRNLVLQWILDDRNDAFKFFACEFTSPARRVLNIETN